MDPWLQVFQIGGPVTTVMLLFLYGFHKEWWVIGNHYWAAQEERLEERKHHREEVRELRAEAQAERDKRDALTERITDEIVPLVTRATDLLRDYVLTGGGSDGPR